MRGSLALLGVWSPLAAQILLGLFGLATFAFTPPERGAMLLVPVTREAQAQLPALAVAHGALLLGRGPGGGSLVVRGDRARLVGALLRHSIITVAAPAILCGLTPGEGLDA